MTEVAEASKKRLRVAFGSQASFFSEYSNNIANGGVFLPTKKVFDVRDPVMVMIRLAYCDAEIPLDGEVVHCVPPELAQAGASPGVAVQFSPSASELRSLFEPYLGDLEPPEKEDEETGRRRSTRTPARVATKVRSDSGSQLEVRTRDISKTGVLISTRGQEIPVGQSVKVDLTHPISGEEMQVEGRVVRHVHSDAGDVTALGIEFDLSDSDAPEVGGFIDRVATTEHSRRLGVIGGPIGDLGVEALLRMFGETAPRGTLILSHAAEEGSVVLCGGCFITASIGKYSGVEALERLLNWRDGSFEFESRIDPEHEGARGKPVEAVLKDIRTGASAAKKKPAGTKIARLKLGPAPDVIPRGAKVCVVFPALDEQGAELSKTEEAVIDLGIVGMTVSKVLEIIPDREEVILSAISNLREQGLVKLES